MFNPGKASEKIKQEFIDYITTSYSFSDSNLKKQFKDELEDFVSKGPYLEINDIFEEGNSINHLIEEGILSRKFLKINSNSDHDILPLNRKLYVHQEEAIRKVVEGQNIVISTGTGSGKTFCFLIPIINELLKEEEEGRLDSGIRAILIYPMNALANDQYRTLKSLLRNYPEITFGIYSGDTPYGKENNSKNETDDIKYQNELTTRVEMQKNPPHILFTNYSMLERLLFDPKGNKLFKNHKLRFIVLDEAHIYSGVTGIETSYLIRRFKARLHVRHAQFILTSATLGGQESDDSDIVKFANNLTGENFKVENIIKARRINFIPSKKVFDYSSNIFNELANDNESTSEVLKKYNIPFEKSKYDNELLYDFLCSSKIYNSFREYFFESQDNVCSMDDLIKNFDFKDEEDLVNFVYLCTKAYKNGHKLIDARFHYFIRGLEGAYIYFEKEPKLSLKRIKDNELNCFEIGVCEDCGKYVLVGKIENNVWDYLKPASLYEDKEEIRYFYPLCSDDEKPEDTSKSFYVCPKCGRFYTNAKYKNSSGCGCNVEAIKLVELYKTKNQNPKCYCCDGSIKRFYIHDDVSTSVLATSMFEELSENKIKSSEEKFDNNLIKEDHSKDCNNQFLVFSDSRQQAAKFACYLSEFNEEFLRRRGICNLIEKNKAKKEQDLSEFVKDLEDYYRSHKILGNSDDDSINIYKREAWVAIINEMARIYSDTSLVSLGIVQFEYKGNNDWIINKYNKKFNISYRAMKELLNLLVFQIVRFGALICDEDSNLLGDAERQYIFYKKAQCYVNLLPKSTDENILSWIPQTKNGKYNSNNPRLKYVKEAFETFNNEDAVDFLKDYFNYLIDSEHNRYCLYQLNCNYVLKTSSFKIKFYSNDDAKFYKCARCGKISQFSLNGKCFHCLFKTKEIKFSEIKDDNHYAKLYFKKNMNPLIIKEHTAQLSREEQREYQKEFMEHKINALSCSTTFELGVDVGDLNTVFLRDFPPSSANYVQRAGRAGRSKNSIAYCLTYAKLSSHDLNFFENPKEMIHGVIKPPLFKLNNEKIAARHIYDIAFGLYFSSFTYEYEGSKNISSFFEDNNYEEFKKRLHMEPRALQDEILITLPKDEKFQNLLGAKNFSWLENFVGDKGCLTSLKKEYDSLISAFDERINDAESKEDLKEAGSVRKQKNVFINMELIQYLVRGNILPKYGFPVDTVQLDVSMSDNGNSDLNLSRDLSMAIGEYAPSSEVIADGRIYTSRYIKKSSVDNDSSFKIGYFAYCPKCSCINYSEKPIIKKFKCKSCGTEITVGRFHESIEPINGFAAEHQTKKVHLLGQERNLVSDSVYIKQTAAKTISTSNYLFEDLEVSVVIRENDQIMNNSKNNFWVCEKCGFSYSDDEFQKIKSRKQVSSNEFEIKELHNDLIGSHKCDNTLFKKFYLHHVFYTDIARINFNLEFPDKKLDSAFLSLMYALLFASCSILDIDRNDMSAILYKEYENSYLHSNFKYSIVFYDNVPGGAGNSKRIVENNGKMFLDIIKKAYKTMKDCDCSTSCYKCLRSYENRNIHNILNRFEALKILEKMIGDCKINETSN